MAMIRCENGHFYDNAKNMLCPACGITGLNVDATIAETSGNIRHDFDIPTKAYGAEPRAGRGVNRPLEPGVTVAHIKKKTGIHPVVGWLVCVEGADKGRDYRIRSERNFIGRDPSMDICISGDDGISRERHAVISYNPRKKSFLLLPGESHGIVYHNSDEVVGPVDLRPFDVLEVSETKLLFIPFCGEKFNWETPQSAQIDD
jgi:hypothetical protein